VEKVCPYVLQVNHSKWQ